MLEEVSSAVGLVSLGARTSVNPHADSGCLGPGGVLGRNLVKTLSDGIDSWRFAVNWPLGMMLTVRPFFRVVVWVFPTVEGVAKPRRRGPAADRPARVRRPCERFKASLRDAMGEGFEG